MTRPTVFRVLSGVIGVMVLSGVRTGWGQSPQPGPSDPGNSSRLTTVLQAPSSPDQPQGGDEKYVVDCAKTHLPFRIEEVDATGILRLERRWGKLFTHPGFKLTHEIDFLPNWYLGLAFDDSEAGIPAVSVVKVKVIECGTLCPPRVKVGMTAAKQLKAGQLLILCLNLTTADEIQELPEIVSLEDPHELWSETIMVERLKRSEDNLRNLADALVAYREHFGHYPPAVVWGPDGKPWHSWRVLILPFLKRKHVSGYARDTERCRWDQGVNKVYLEYRFDEPWDGPHNSRLLEQMPEVYSDPIHGANREFFAHYAVPVGDTMQFRAQGVQMADRHDRSFLNPILRIASRLSLTYHRPVQYGVYYNSQYYNSDDDLILENLLLIPVTPERKIPWMKPEDLDLELNFPRVKPGRPIPTPYVWNKRRAALAIFACRNKPLIPVHKYFCSVVSRDGSPDPVPSDDRGLAFLNSASLSIRDTGALNDSLGWGMGSGIPGSGGLGVAPRRDVGKLGQDSRGGGGAGGAMPGMGTMPGLPQRNHNSTLGKFGMGGGMGTMPGAGQDIGQLMKMSSPMAPRHLAQVFGSWGWCRDPVIRITRNEAGTRAVLE